ncbi:adenine deaminase [Verrucomicrobia bacterium S94]|nr:adenine deaminase [Verrucomicrobia bacterium S94]
MSDTDYSRKISSRGHFSVSGVLIRPGTREKFGARIEVQQGRIHSIIRDDRVAGPFIMPGFIDAHVHIESSLMIPSQFARVAVKHGTVAVVADPHEVANVAGEAGVRFMVRNAESVPLYFFFGVPSCVPASPLEKSGAVLSAADVERLLAEEDFHFLAEMMNFPGVVGGDDEVHAKLRVARAAGKPIDGHAPGLEGEDLRKYVQSGISTDHECTTLEEALAKIESGQKIQIREGSAARNFDSLAALIPQYPESVMICTDDCHPDDLERRHMNKIVSRAVARGYDLFDVLTVATANPVPHYGLPVGQLNEGDPADFIVVDDVVDFNVLETYINGVKVFDQNGVLFEPGKMIPPQFTFRDAVPDTDSIKVTASSETMNVIKAVPGELLTGWKTVPVVPGAEIVSDTEKDLLKIVVLDRYENTPPAIGFITGFGLKSGALAASIAHDSHHLLAIGGDDQSIVNALSWIVEHKGGLCYASESDVTGITLPFYGLMSDRPGEEISRLYQELNAEVVHAGCTIGAPFMTASFMALTVIPALKINHNGLFDVAQFRNIPLCT